MNVSRRLTHVRVQNSRSSRCGQIVRSRCDPCLLLVDQIGVLMEEKKGYAAALEHVRSEHLRVLDHVKRLLDQSDVSGVRLIESTP